MLAHVAEYHAINAVRDAAANLELALSSETMPNLPPSTLFDQMFEESDPFPYEVDDSPWHYPARADGISQHDRLTRTETGRYMPQQVETIVARGQEAHNRIMTGGPRRVEALGGQYQYLFDDDSSSDEEWDAEADLDEVADEAVQLRRDLGHAEEAIIDGYFGDAESTSFDEDADTDESVGEGSEDDSEDSSVGHSTDQPNFDGVSPSEHEDYEDVTYIGEGENDDLDDHHYSENEESGEGDT